MSDQNGSVVIDASTINEYVRTGKMPKTKPVHDGDPRAYHGLTGESKVERYGWKIKDQPGRLCSIAKTMLKCDPTYQREPNYRKIKAIAADWSWLACGTLQVADRDGEFYVFDGNTRREAAALRSDIQDLPCNVFSTEGVNQEAQAFLDANTFRSPVRAAEKYRAMIQIGDTNALAVRDLLAESGYEVGQSPGNRRQVACIGKLLELHQGFQEDLLRVWPVIVAAVGDNRINERILSTLVYIETRINPDKSLTRQPYKDRLIRLGSKGILNACAAASAMYARGGARIWAEGVIIALNKGTTTNRLSLGMDSD